MTRRGFTMLELVIVLVIVGMTATLVVTGVVRSNPAIQRRDAVTAIHTALLHARADAMQLGEQVSVRVEFGEDSTITILREHASEVVVSAPSLIRHILNTPAGPNALTDPNAPLSATFSSGGRTDQREWAFGLDDSADTLWTIRFDPLSGAPRLIEGVSADSAAESAAIIPSTERRP